MKFRLKEHSLTQVVMICERCLLEIAPLKTIEFYSNELHYAKCVFGTLKKIST